MGRNQSEEIEHTPTHQSESLGRMKRALTPRCLLASCGPPRARYQPLPDSEGYASELTVRLDESGSLWIKASTTTQ